MQWRDPSVRNGGNKCAISTMNAGEFESWETSAPAYVSMIAWQCSRALWWRCWAKMPSITVAPYGMPLVDSVIYRGEFSMRQPRNDCRRNLKRHSDHISHPIQG